MFMTFSWLFILLYECLQIFVHIQVQHDLNTKRLEPVSFVLHPNIQLAMTLLGLGNNVPIGLDKFITLSLYLTLMAMYFLPFLVDLFVTFFSERGSFHPGSSPLPGAIWRPT
jgi:hypothetical protein